MRAAHINTAELDTLGVRCIDRAVELLGGGCPTLEQSLLEMKEDLLTLVERVKRVNEALRLEAEERAKRATSDWDIRMMELLDEVPHDQKVWFIKDDGRCLTRVNRGFSITELLGISNLINITLTGILDSEYKQHLKEVRSFVVTLEQPKEEKKEEEQTDGQC